MSRKGCLIVLWAADRKGRTPAAGSLPSFPSEGEQCLLPPSQIGPAEARQTDCGPRLRAGPACALAVDSGVRCCRIQTRIGARASGPKSSPRTCQSRKSAFSCLKSAKGPAYLAISDRRHRCRWGRLRVWSSFRFVSRSCARDTG